jgi:hypothetical protein
MRTSSKVAITMALAALLSAPIHAQDSRLDLAGIGGFAVTPDNVTLIIAVTSKTELVYYDTVAGKESKRVKVEFQPTRMALSGNVLFVAQKGSGIVHILDAANGKELKTAKTGAPIKDVAALSAKPIAIVTNANREVYVVDDKGGSSKAAGVQGDYVAVDPSAGAFICTTVNGRVRSDLFKYVVDGKELKSGENMPGAGVNISGLAVSPDGQQVAVVAGGGYVEQGSRKRHYSVPVYSTSELKTMLGEMETTPYPSGVAYHPTQPLAAAMNGGSGSLFNTKSFAGTKKIEAAKAGTVTVLAFVGKGKKLAIGTTNGDVSTVTFMEIAE